MNDREDGKKRNREIADENRRIGEKGYYIKDKSRHFLKLKREERESACVYTPEKLQEIYWNVNDDLDKRTIETNGKIGLVNADSFEAAEPSAPERPEKVLVLNFANARTRGGGYLNGAFAQEESLCRESTLYESLCSRDASAMYEANRNSIEPLDTDYMILSPKVEVFRSADGELLDETYVISVITAPAPNRNGRAKDETDEAVQEVMENRIHYILSLATSLGYNTIVLGAWGCGAFGHRAKDVSGYFYNALIGEDLRYLFKKIIFAVYDRSEEQANYKAFEETFRGETEPTSEEERLVYELYAESSYPHPVCSHPVNGITENNLGCTSGVTFDNVPFEAEEWYDPGNKTTGITVYIPVLDTIHNPESDIEKDRSDNIVGFHNEITQKRMNVMSVGMAIREEQCADDDAKGYLYFLIERGILKPACDMMNVHVDLLTDIEGHDLAAIFVALSENGNTYFYTNLTFRPFTGHGGRGRIIQFPQK